MRQNFRTISFAFPLVALAMAPLPAVAQSMAAMPMAAPAPAKTAMVQIKNFDFTPMDVTIVAGGSVTWKNFDGEPHTVTGVDGSFRSGAMDQGDSYTFKFDKPGVYQYLCNIHPKMRATITVR
jgi:plastocyanin